MNGFHWVVSGTFGSAAVVLDEERRMKDLGVEHGQFLEHRQQSQCLAHRQQSR
jgi:hypothetical protein